MRLFGRRGAPRTSVERQPPNVLKLPPITDPSVVCPATKYVFDLTTYTWKEETTIIKVLDPVKSFARGGMRSCFEVQEIDKDGCPTSMVAKVFSRRLKARKSSYFNEGEAQCMCEEFAENFNRTKRAVKKRTVSFLQCCVVVILDSSIPEKYHPKYPSFFAYRTRDTHEVMFIMEPKLDGHFTKYNSNAGDVYLEFESWSVTSSEQMHRRSAFDTAEAFSHFTLVESGGSMLVCDLQGVNDLLTDPQIHTEDGKGLGMGNLGQNGIDKWVQAHRCNQICRALNFHPLSRMEESANGRRAKKPNRHAILRAELNSRHPMSVDALIPFSKPMEEMTEEEMIEYVMKLSELTT